MPDSNTTHGIFVSLTL